MSNRPRDDLYPRRKLTERDRLVKVREEIRGIVGSATGHAQWTGAQVGGVRSAETAMRNSVAPLRSPTRLA